MTTSLAERTNLGLRVGKLIGSVSVSAVVFQGKSHAIFDFPSDIIGRSVPERTME